MERGQQGDQAAGASLLGKQDERAGTLPAGGQKDPGRPYNSFQYLNGTTGELQRDFSPEHLVLG